MYKLIITLIAVALLGLFVAGCDNQNPTANSSSLPSFPNAGSAKLSIPDGAVLTSATLYLFVEEGANQTVNVHRATAPWSEMDVSWDSFAESYDPAVVGSFISDAIGWKMIDVAPVIQGYLDGTYENYGFLIEQNAAGLTYIHSSEYVLPERHPKLEICYELNGMTECFTVQRGYYGEVADAFILEVSPEYNAGDWETLLVGINEDLRKQSLIMFDITVDEPESHGCTRTIGYWKNHAGFGPQDDMVTALLPVWLGTPDGDKSLYVESAQMVYDIMEMKTYGASNNGITKLYAQLLAAKLNILSDADDMDVADAINKADAFLAMHDYNDWGSLSKKTQKDVLKLKDMFDNYNNGLIGPGHCE